MSKKYKKPDLKAPRYRSKRLNLTNFETYTKFLNENPYVETICLEKFKEVISTFNEMIWKSVIEDRNGVELPEQLGYIFIGSCPRKKSKVDFNKSKIYGVKLQNQNWESDQYTAKIFYTNYEGKYKFRNHELWGFTGVRNFKREVGQTYPKEWKKYIMVDNMVKVSRVFRKQSYIQYKQKETKNLLDTYDDFNFD